MSAAGGIPTAVLETLEFPSALERVALHAVGPLGAERVRGRTPLADATAIRDALAQVTELAAQLITDDALRAEPVPNISDTLAILRIPGGVPEATALAALAVTLGAIRTVGVLLGRLERTAPRTATLRTPALDKQLEKRLTESIVPDGAVLDAASRDLARARKAVRETRQRLVTRLERLLGNLDAQDRAPQQCIATTLCGLGGRIPSWPQGGRLR